MNMATSTWMPAAYIVIGLLVAAWAWHGMYTEETFDRYLDEDRPPLPRRLAGQIFTGSLFVAVLLAGLLWPIMLPRMMFVRLRARRNRGR